VPLASTEPAAPPAAAPVMSLGEAPTEHCPEPEVAVIPVASLRPTDAEFLASEHVVDPVSGWSLVRETYRGRNGRQFYYERIDRPGKPRPQSGSPIRRSLTCRPTWRSLSRMVASSRPRVSSTARRSSGASPSWPRARACLPATRSTPRCRATSERSTSDPSAQTRTTTSPLCAPAAPGGHELCAPGGCACRGGAARASPTTASPPTACAAGFADGTRRPCLTSPR